MCIYFPGSSICPKPLILSRACAAGATARLVEQNVRYEAAQGINGSVPLKQSPRSAASPKPQGKCSPIVLLGTLRLMRAAEHLERIVFEREKTMGHKLAAEIQMFCKSLGIL